MFFSWETPAPSSFSTLLFLFSSFPRASWAPSICIWTSHVLLLNQAPGLLAPLSPCSVFLYYSWILALNLAFNSDRFFPKPSYTQLWFFFNVCLHYDYPFHGIYLECNCQMSVQTAFIELFITLTSWHLCSYHLSILVALGLTSDSSQM